MQGLFTDGMNGYQQASIIRALCSVSPDTVSQVVEQVRGNLQKILPRSDRLLFIAPLTGALCFIPPASIPTVCEYLPRISFKYRNAFDFAEVAKYLGQVAPDVIPQVVTLIQENSETDFLESDELEGLLSVPQEAIPPICQALRTYRRGYEPINKLIRALGAFSPNIISSLCEGDSSVLKYNRRQRGITEMLGALSLLEEERVLVVYQYAQEFCRNINFASGQTSEIIEILGSLSPVNAAAFFEEASSINKAGINPWDYIRRLRKLRSQYELERGE